MLLVITTIPIRWRKILVLFFAVGVVLTFSRSSILIFGLSVASLMALGVLGQTKPVPVLIMSLLLLLGVGVFELLLQNVALWAINQLDVEQYDRIAFFLSFSTEDASSTARLSVAQTALQQFFEEPIIGHGFGKPEEIGIHNTYLTLLWQHGVTGLTVIGVLILALLNRVTGQELIMRNIILMSLLMHLFFSHHALTDRPILFAIALLAAWLNEAQAVEAKSVNESKLRAVLELKSSRDDTI
jgi:O-antigen ligase